MVCASVKAVDDVGSLSAYGTAEQSLDIGDDLIRVVAGVKARTDVGVQQELHHRRGADTVHIELAGRHP